MLTIKSVKKGDSLSKPAGRILWCNVAAPDDGFLVSTERNGPVFLSKTLLESLAAAENPDGEWWHDEWNVEEDEDADQEE